MDPAARFGPQRCAISFARALDLRAYCWDDESSIASATRKTGKIKRRGTW
jgi:hypothetical protein